MKKGVPPATDPPNQSLRIWSLLKDCWSKVPASRPSAAALAYTLETAQFRLPSTILVRILTFSSQIGANVAENDYNQAWKVRTQLLWTLCLVSKAYRSIAMPFLYSEIKFITAPRTSAPLLLSTLRSKSPVGQLNNGPDALYTKALVYTIGEGLSNTLWSYTIELETLLTLVQFLNGLKSVVLTGFGTPTGTRSPYEVVIVPRIFEPSFLLNSVTFDVSSPFTIIHGLIAFGPTPFLQELFVTLHPPKAGDYVPNEVTRNNVQLPNLQNININGVGRHLGVLLRTLSIWRLPLLNSFYISSGEELRECESDLRQFLQVHGNGLHHLTLDLPPLFTLREMLSYCEVLETVSFPVSEPYLPELDYLAQLDYKHQSLSGIKMLYSVGVQVSAVRFNRQKLVVFLNEIRRWYPNLMDVIVLSRAPSGVLDWAASIDARHGAIFEWDGAESRDDRITWTLIEEPTSGSMLYEL